MMLEGVDVERIQAMTSQELRWLDNTKKALYESDVALQSGRAEDACFESLCKAVDVAKTLQRSLMWMAVRTCALLVNYEGDRQRGW